MGAPLPPRRKRRAQALVLLLACAWLAGAWGRGAEAAPGLAIDAGDFPLIRVFAEIDALPGSGAEDAPILSENGAALADPMVLDRAQPLPLRLVLLVDTSGSMRNAMDAVRHAAAEAVQRLADTDALGLIAFADEVRPLAEPTRDRRQLGAAIAGLKAEGGTALYDAIKAGVAQVREAGGGRRAVVVLTDGKDEGAPGTPGSTTRLEPLKRILAEAGVPVYVLALGSDVDLAVLQEIATESGGRVYSAARPDALAALYGEVFASLRGSGGWSYVSPQLALDGTRRTVEAVWPNGRRLTATYPVPREPGVIWRYTRTGEAGGQCSAAGLSPSGTLALLPLPPAWVRADGTLLATLPLGGPYDRMAVLEQGTGFGFTGAHGDAFAFTPGEGQTAAPPALQAAGPQATPGAPIAVSPNGATLLWLHPPTGASKPTFSARQGPQAVPLWERALCPFSACDRATGAAVGDDGTALLNLTGVLQRVAANGTPGAAPRETFFPSVSLSADGTLGTAVVWRPAPKRALLLDAQLRTVMELSLRSYLDAVPAVAAISPDGRWVAARDDFQVQVLDVATRRGRTLALPRLRPGAACALTLAVDDTGRVLTGDGASIFLLQGAAPAAQ